MKQPPLPIFRSGSGDAFCGRGKRGRPCRREGACGSRLVIERRKRQRACGQGAGLCQEASGRRCCIRTSFSPRRAEGHIERDVRCSPPPGAAAGCRAVARNGSRTKLRKSAIVRIATFADGGRTSGERLACEPAVRRMGAAAGCRAVARNDSRTEACGEAPSYESQRSPAAAGRVVSGLPANLPSATWGGGERHTLRAICFRHSAKARLRAAVL